MPIAGAGYRQVPGEKYGCIRLRLLCLRVLLHLHALHARHDLRFCFLAASSSDVRDSFRVSLPSPLRLMSDFRKRRATRFQGSSTLCVTWVAASSLRPQEQSSPTALYFIRPICRSTCSPAILHCQPGQRAYFIFRWGRRWAGSGPDGTSCALSGTQSTGGAMAYQDIYFLLACMSAGMLGCAFLLSKNKPGAGAPPGEAMH